MTDVAQVSSALKALTLDGLAAIEASQFGMDGFKGAVAFHDPRKDELITALPVFSAAVEALKDFPRINSLFGATEAQRIALQFVFNAYPSASHPESYEAAFEYAWNSFTRELDKPTWTFASVANIQNLQCSEPEVDLGDGISIRGRSFKDLAKLLHWGPWELDLLMTDWMASGGASSYVLFLTREVPKSQEKFDIIQRWSRSFACCKNAFSP